MINELFKKAGINISKEQIVLFEKFLEIFEEKNKEINLSAIRKKEDIIIKHFIDSLSIIDLKEYKDSKTIVDIGTGGGFPGIPLAIFSAEKQFLLVDSVKKKISMINFFIQYLGLKNVKTIDSRAEIIGQKILYRENFDLCVSRSVAYFPVLLEYCLPFVKLGGNFISYKERNELEIKEGERAVKILGGKINKIVDYSLLDLENRRNLIVIKKIKKTSIEYPRSVGEPKKKPL